MTDLFAKCSDCGCVWLVAKLPADLRKVGQLSRKAACANGCKSKPVLASDPDPDQLAHWMPLPEPPAALLPAGEGE